MARTRVATAYGYFPDTLQVDARRRPQTPRISVSRHCRREASAGTSRIRPGAGIPNATSSAEYAALDVTDATGSSRSLRFPRDGTFVLDFWTSIPDSSWSRSSRERIPMSTSRSNRWSSRTTSKTPSAAGWSVNAQGGDNATSGVWTRVNPRGTGGGLVQPEDDHTRDRSPEMLHHGQGFARRRRRRSRRRRRKDDALLGEHRSDGGRVPSIQYFRWYVNDAGDSPGEDVWKAQISSNGGTTWVTTDSTRHDRRRGKRCRVHVADYVTPSTRLRMRFIAEDAGGGSIVEAGSTTSASGAPR